jgi:membrane protein YdbS with pleckstrin-like domain
MPSEETPTPSVPTAASRGSALPRIVNNFVHDMSTGTWAACILVIWVITSRSLGVSSEAAAVLSEANTVVFWLLVVSLVGLTVTGAIRLLYWRSDTPPEQLKTKRGALIVKHIAFLLVYGLGTAWAAWMVFG